MANRKLVHKNLTRDIPKSKLKKACCTSLNNVISPRLPKTTFVMRNAQGLGRYEAKASYTYNEENIVKCKIFGQLGITPGASCVGGKKKLDN
ncbi:hypothetical protein J6590_038935 [Homalodisca vitripennis]|nr:hypothetical protein J6590_038935 [Homalodisca vitripennis]